MQNLSKPTIVVGVDYSETSVLALKRALELAQGGTLHVLHAVEMLGWAVPSVAGPVAPVVIPFEEEASTLARYVEEQLAALRGGPGEPPLPLVVSHLALGAPADELVQMASDLQADILVVGTHGRKGVERLLIGSTAERVVRLARCPVLVERARDSKVEAGPRIEPPCPRCIDTRTSTGGAELWCSQHRERHGRRHTFHSADHRTAFPSPHGGLSSIC